jgi:NAD(P)-dependent dehydrogenase (short-subunit alcohol dehydrogenase family)
MPPDALNTEFAGKTALVTGGTRGIGEAVGSALLAAGCRVIVTGLPGETPSVKGLEVHSLDVGDQDEVDAVFKNINSLDILVNSAGTIARDREFEIDTFMRVLDVNLTGTMRMCVGAKPMLARNGGAIVNVASLWSFFGGPRVPAYTASKGGIAQLTKSLAVAWAGDGIRVNAVAPGWIATDLTRGVQQDPAVSAKILDRTPMRRWGKPEDVAGPVIFLCSQAASFITGAVLPVDGGYCAV